LPAILTLSLHDALPISLDGSPPSTASSRSTTSGSALDSTARSEVAGKYGGAPSAWRIACTDTSRAWVYPTLAPNQKATCNGMVEIGRAHVRTPVTWPSP